MNSTDAGLRMCAGEIRPKLHLTSILSKAQIPGQAQASPRAKKAHLAATQEKETKPMRMTRHQSEVKPSRRIRCIHKDLQAHQSYQTDSRQALTHIYHMGVHVAASRLKTRPNGLSPRSADLQVARPSPGGPRAPPPLRRHVARCG